MREEWRIVERYPLYEVSDNCEVRNIKTKRVMEPEYNYKDDEMKVRLSDRFGKYHWVSMKRIVAEAFWGGPHDDCDVELYDGDIYNLTPINLRWKKIKERKPEYDSSNDVRYILVKETGDKFNSLQECCDVLGITVADARSCLDNPNRKSRNGYHLYLTEE